MIISPKLFSSPLLMKIVNRFSSLSNSWSITSKFETILTSSVYPPASTSKRFTRPVLSESNWPNAGVTIKTKSNGKHYWFEVILADPEHPRIAQDKELNQRISQAA